MANYKIFIALAIAVTFLNVCVRINAHADCEVIPDSVFNNGSQHCDCDYTTPPVDPHTVANDSQHQIDLYWINLVHEYAVTNMAKYPFGAALVDSRNNTLVTMGYNMFFTADPWYSSIALSHAETVVITNASINIFPGSFNQSTLSRHVDPNWQYLTLYGNIETCPMCAQAAIWRGLRQMVFGARASVLQAERCWTQPTLTTYEMVDHSASFAPFNFVRGPMPELEMKIVNDFKLQCTTAATTDSNAATTGSADTFSTTTSNGARSASSPYSSLIDNLRALL